MAKNEKPFDAVRMMRSIRNDFEERMRGMTFDEEQAYIRERLQSRSADSISGADVARIMPTGHTAESAGGS